MRVTVDSDEDIARAIEELARERGQSVGRVLSDLARRGLKVKTRNGVPLLMPRPGARMFSSEHVRELLELDD